MPIHARSSLWWAICGLGLIGLWITLQPIYAQDFWWHIKIGDWIRNQGAIPDTGIYSATQAATPYTYLSWSSDVVLSWLFQAGGLALVHSTRTLLILLTYSLFTWHTWQRTHNGRAVAIALLLASVVSYVQWLNSGPVLFVLPLCMLSSLILDQVSRERWNLRTLTIIPLLQILWTNLHPSFLLGPIFVAAYAFGASIDRRRDHLEAPIYGTMRALWLTAAATSIAMLLNPHVFGAITATVSHTFTLLFQQIIGAWSTPFIQLDQQIAQHFALTLIVGILFIVVMWDKLRAVDLMIAATVTLLALMSIRHLIWFGLLVPPITVDAIIRRGRLRITKTTREATPIALSLALTVGLLTIGLQAPWRGLFPLPEQLATRNEPLKRADLISDTTPIGAAEYLITQTPATSIFHDHMYGSYLMWRSGETTPVFLDPRAPLYPQQQWRDFRCIAQAQNWQELLATYKITTVLVNKLEQPGLAIALRQAPGWTEVYADSYSMIFEQTSQVAIEAQPCLLP